MKQRLRKTNKVKKQYGRKPAFLSLEPARRITPTQLSSYLDLTEQEMFGVVLSGDRISTGKMAKKVRLGDLNLTNLDPSPEHIELVREALARVSRRCAILTGILNTLEMVAGLTSTVADGKATLQVTRLPARKRLSPPSEPEKLVVRSGSWSDWIIRILTEAGKPLTIEEIREQFSKTPLGPNMIETNGRSYYAAAAKLKMAGHLVVHNNALTTPTVLRRFLADVAAGRAVDIVHARYRNTYREALYRFLQSKPEGASFTEIMDHLRDVEGIKSDGKVLNQKIYVLSLLRKMIYHSKTVIRPKKNFYKLAASEFSAGVVETEKSLENDLLSKG
jgi:hypothetical protein